MPIQGFDLVETVGSGARQIESTFFASPTRRLIWAQNNIILEKQKTASTAFSMYPVAKWVEASTLKITSEETSVPQLFFLELGLSTAEKLTLDVVLFTDNVAPTSKFDFFLYKAEKTEAAEKKVEVTFESAIAATKTTINKPAAKTFNHAATTFLCPAAGQYAIGLETTTESAAKSFCPTTCSLFASS